MKILRAVVFILLLLPNVVRADDQLDSLLNMSFKELKNIKVTSVSRKAESSFEAAAAIHVVTSEDIRRSGVSSIPEALRMVPGLNVANIDANKWAITSRGFNEQFSNKLLVLIDGRTIYTPLFSGVYWGVQDTLLEDVDRIEVIRGPGATLWGANAVNGIINIITKDSKNTQGLYAEASLGNEELGSVSARMGGKISDNLYYRVYGKYKKIDDSVVASTGLDANDGWSQARAGFRVDWDNAAKNKISVHGDVYDGKENQIYHLPQADASTIPFEGDENARGANLVVNWEKQLSERSSISLQAYVDFIERNISILDQERLTIDIDFQHSLDINDRNEFIWGLGYRHFQDDLDEKTVTAANVKYLDYTPDNANENLYSGFIQDKITLVPDNLFLTVGTKFEHHYYTGWEIQPNARIAWLPDDKQTVWAAVSKAARTPTRGENGLVLVGIPGSLNQTGSTNYDSEYLTAYEIGYRFQPSWKWSADLAVFYNDYSDLQTFEFVPPINLSADNNAAGEGYGVELSSRYSVTKDWNLYANYSFLTLDVHLDPGVVELVPFIEVNEGRTAKHQLSLFSRVNLPYDVELDNSVYYVDNLSGLGIPAYIRLDARLGWKPVEGIELSLVGQNLTDDRHPEFESSLYSVASEIGRSVYGKISYRF